MGNTPPNGALQPTGPSRILVPRRRVTSSAAHSVTPAVSDPELNLSLRQTGSLSLTAAKRSPGSRYAALAAAVLAAACAVGRPVAAQPPAPEAAPMGAAVDSVRARVRTVLRAHPSVAEDAWRAAARAADSLLARAGDRSPPELRVLRGVAALSLAELRVAAAGRDTTCASAR